MSEEKQDKNERFLVHVSLAVETKAQRDSLLKLLRKKLPKAEKEKQKIGADTLAYMITFLTHISKVEVSSFDLLENTRQLLIIKENAMAIKSCIIGLYRGDEHISADMQDYIHLISKFEQLKINEDNNQ